MYRQASPTRLSNHPVLLMIQVFEPLRFMIESRTPKNRRLQLDAIRGFAVLLVVIHHWTKQGHSLGLGNIGVQLFFVLSGFLITGILLKQRARIESASDDFWTVIRVFFFRRVTRIWPVMFVTLGLVYLAGDRFERQADMMWHFLFSSNVLFFFRGEFGSALAHFWSLAVEQQFYVFWPFIVLLAPRGSLSPIILLAILLAPVSRLILYRQGYTHFASFNVLPFANLDSLGIGALAAFGRVEQRPYIASRLRLMSIPALVLALAAFMASLPANVSQTFYAVAFGSLILGAHQGFRGWRGRLLESRWLIDLGTISYGVYVYHMFAPRAVAAALRGVGAPDLLNSDGPLLAVSAVLTLVLATVSWRFMEQPFIQLGRNPS